MKKLIKKTSSIELGDDFERRELVEHIDESITAHNDNLTHRAVPTEQYPQI